MKNLKILVFYVHILQIIVNINCQQYFVPTGRDLHTATLVGTKIYFLGGRLTLDNFYSNDFFYLDISKSFDKTEEGLPFVNLTSEGLEIPPHYGAATSVFGKLKDSIFFFGGDTGSSNDKFGLAYSFNTTQSEWKLIIPQGMIPVRKGFMNAVTDNNNRIYLFGGYRYYRYRYVVTNYPEDFYNNEMNIFDTLNEFWIMGSDGGLIGRDGHTATFLPDTGEIIYIGGHGINGPMDVTDLDVYNTTGNTWNKLITKNAPEEGRCYHTAVLTNDRRIIVFGGTQADYIQPVKSYYVVLDTKTLEWYYGNDVSTNAPFKFHTATLYKDFMFIAFGRIYSTDGFRLSDDILIYKIGDYANFTELKYFNENLGTEETFSITLLLLLSIILLGSLGFIGFTIFKW